MDSQVSKPIRLLSFKCVPFVSFILQGIIILILCTNITFFYVFSSFHSCSWKAPHRWILRWTTSSPSTWTSRDSSLDSWRTRTQTNIAACSCLQQHQGTTSCRHICFSFCSKSDCTRVRRVPHQFHKCVNNREHSSNKWRVHCSLHSKSKSHLSTTPTNSNTISETQKHRAAETLLTLFLLTSRSVWMMCLQNRQNFPSWFRRMHYSLANHSDSARSYKVTYKVTYKDHTHREIKTRLRSHLKVKSTFPLLILAVLLLLRLPNS